MASCYLILGWLKAWLFSSSFHPVSYFGFLSVKLSMLAGVYKRSPNYSLPLPRSSHFQVSDFSSYQVNAKLQSTFKERQCTEKEHCWQLSFFLSPAGCVSFPTVSRQDPPMGMHFMFNCGHGAGTYLHLPTTSLFQILFVFYFCGTCLC